MHAVDKVIALMFLSDRIREEVGESPLTDTEEDFIIEAVKSEFNGIETEEGATKFIEAAVGLARKLIFDLQSSGAYKGGGQSGASINDNWRNQ